MGSVNNNEALIICEVDTYISETRFISRTPRPSHFTKIGLFMPSASSAPAVVKFGYFIKWGSGNNNVALILCEVGTLVFVFATTK